MAILKFKKNFLLIVLLSTLVSCGGKRGKIPNPLYYFDDIVKYNDHSDFVTNDKINNRFIYKVEYFSNDKIGQKNSFTPLIHFYNYDNEKYDSYNIPFKIYDNFSKSYLEKNDNDVYEFTNVQSREFYIYYDDIHKTISEKFFEKYSFFIVLIDFNRYSNDRTKTMWD